MTANESATQSADWIEQDSSFRGDVIKYYPTKTQLKDPGGLDKYILDRWMPKQPSRHPADSHRTQ